MTSRVIVPIVEGHGEVEALPVLIRRIFQTFRPGVSLDINPPTRVKVGSFLRDNDYFHKYVSLADAKAAPRDGVVLILLDCEDDCPSRLGPDLIAKAQAVRTDLRCVVALAYREYETWFLTAADSLRGCAGLPMTLSRPPCPESIRGAKEWLGRHLPANYDPIIHQAPMSACLDLHQARANASLSRLVNKLIGSHFSLAKSS